LNTQITLKNKKVEKLQTIVYWYKKITGIHPAANLEMNDINNILNDNFYNNEYALNQKIQKLKETILILTEKKNYYKSKVNILNFKG